MKAILELKQESGYSISPLIKIANISKSTFYYVKMTLERTDKYLDEKKFITEIYHKNKGRYGYRRITIALRLQFGLVINHKTVLRLMKELGIACNIRVKKYKSYKGAYGKTVKNLFITKTVDKANHKTYYKRNFVTERSNEKWVTDITEFKVCGIKVYLSPIIDLNDKVVLSYQISLSPSIRFVVNMLKDAILKHKPKNLIIHSDQGWHYQNKRFQAVLEEYNITQSMSRKGNCYDNSLAENFFGILKSEFYYPEKFKTVDEFILKLKEYIDYYCNERISLKLKGMTPNEFRESRLIIS